METRRRLAIWTAMGAALGRVSAAVHEVSPDFRRGIATLCVR